MISSALFIALLVFDLVLIAAAFFAHNNDLYADILAAVGATVLSWYLSLSALSGNVGDTVPLTNTTLENATTGLTTVTYTTATVPLVDPGLALLLSGLAAVMTVITLGLVLGAVLEIINKE